MGRLPTNFCVIELLKIERYTCLVKDKLLKKNLLKKEPCSVVL